MARRISELRTVNKSANTSREYLLLSNIDSSSSSKIGLNDVLPTLQSGKIASGGFTKGAEGTTVQDLFVGGGVGSSVANTDKSILIFKGITVDDDTGVIKVRTDKSTADGTKQNIVIALNQANINLNTANNDTSKFLSETGGSNALNLGTSSHVAGILPVEHGGTGQDRHTGNSLLVGNGTSAIQDIGTMSKGALVVGTATNANPVVVTVGTNDQVLIADSTQASGLKWGDPVFTSTSFSGNIVTNNNDIKIGTGVIRGSDNDRGIALNTTTDNVFVGGSSRYYTGVMNVGGDLYVGTSTGDTAQKVQANTCSSGASPNFTIHGSNNDDSNNGGDVTIQGGTGDGNGNGGDIIIQSGTKAGAGTVGTLKLKVASDEVMTIGADKHVEFKDQVSFTDSTGIVAKGTAAVTQATSITTAVTLNSFAGVITLHGTAITNNTEQEFTVNNSLVDTDSVIIVSVQDATADVAGATLCATVNSLASGSFVVRLTNPGTAATGTSNKIHFFVINVEA